MTERERRQRRLLSVRALEADLAAVHLRVLRSEQEETRRHLSHWQQLLQVDAASVAPVHTQWLLACAEQELAGRRADRLIEEMDQRVPLIQAQADGERERRIAREQMQRLCDGTAASTRVVAERMEQARLDDLFSASRLRKIAEARSHGGI